MKVSIRYIHEDSFTGDDWVHMDVMFKGRLVEFRNDDDGFTLPVDYLKTYSDLALEERFSRHMRFKQYIKDILHDKDITEEQALGKILTDLFLKG